MEKPTVSGVIDESIPLVFGELPPKRTGKHLRDTSKWQRIATELRSHPGEWAVVHEAPRNARAAAVPSLRRYFDDDEVEVAERRTDSDTVQAWARYTGAAL